MKITLLLLAVMAGSITFAQKGLPDIKEKEVARVENTLASDDMRGRKVGTPDIDKAAAFIVSEFKKAGLQPLDQSDYLQPFTMTKPKLVSTNAEFDGEDIDPKKVIAITSQPDLTLTENSGYDTTYINAGDNIYEAVMKVMGQKKNQLVFVDSSFAKMFPRLNGFKQVVMSSPTSVVFVSGSYRPQKYLIHVVHQMDEMKLNNIVGMLPGTTKKNEYVIFSAHYDHLGVGKPQGTDSIYNGANDDAAGTTAVIELAYYFKKLHHNERTLIFAAFTAEEIGEYGSQYFSKQMDPQKVVAMFNIEMIGTESKWGRNSAYITGYDKTDMGAIMQKNLQGTGFTFYPDPYTKENLFYRSDNASLAKQGVAAHTISTSKMDNEPNYHKVSDEVRTLDLNNMTQIIKAIALSATSIVNGVDTPTRVQPESLSR